MNPGKQNQASSAVLGIIAGGLTWFITKAIVSFAMLALFRTMGLSEEFSMRNAEGIGVISALIAMIVVMDIVRKRIMK